MASASETRTRTVDGGKKRKRDADGSSKKDKSKKKHVTIREPRDASLPTKDVQVIGAVQPQFSAPVIATTPGLVVPDTAEFNSFARPLSKSIKKSRTAPSQSELLLHSTSHHTVSYTGKEDTAPNASGSAMRHYIGVYDPETGALKVVEAKKMIIRGSVRAREASEDDMRGVSLESTMLHLRNELGQTFGTKKAKKAIQSLTENAISTRKRNGDGRFDPVTMDASDHAQLQAMEAATSGMSTREQLQEAVDQAKPVPRANMAATEVQDVYVPAQLAGGADVLAAVPVRDWQDKVRAGEEIQLYSRFVAQRVNHVAARANAEADMDMDVDGGRGSYGLELLRLMRYMYWVMLYYQAARPGKKRDAGKRQPPREKLREKMDGAPEMIVEQIRRQFSENGTLRKYHQDLIATYCCAMACLLDGFEVNMYDLREDLKLEPQQMSQYFSEIGARIKVEKTADRVSHVAKLALPLKFPGGLRSRRRR